MDNIKKTTKWNDFVKSNYDKSKHLPANERLKFISQIYKSKKDKKKDKKNRQKENKKLRDKNPPLYNEPELPSYY